MKTNQDSTDKTNYDAYQEAAELTKPLIKDFENRRSFILQYAAVIISLVSVYLMAVIYAYDRGYFAVYRIPVNYSEVDLRRLLPLFVKSIASITYIGYYIGSLEYERIYQKKSLKFYRILWGSTVLMTVVVQYIHNVFICIGVSLVIPIVFELFVFVIKSISIREEKLPPAAYKIRVEDFVFNQILSAYSKKPIIFLLVIVIIVAPFWGELTARQKLEYESISIGEQDYVIVSKVGDNAYIEPYDADDGNAVIHTDKYIRTAINDHEIRVIAFKSVSIE